MWVRFVYDAETGGTNFKPGNQVEVPDYVTRRWQLTYDLYFEMQVEMQEWKTRSWNPQTRALPAQESVILPIQEVS